jgi:hypothetical protein
MMRPQRETARAREHETKWIMRSRGAGHGRRKREGDLSMGLVRLGSVPGDGAAACQLARRAVGGS